MMFRLILLISLAYVLSSCASVAHQGKFSHNVKISDSHGKTYSLSTIAAQLKGEYELESKPKIILVLSSSRNTLNYAKQMENVYSVNPEEYGYILVVGLQSNRINSGYSISSKDAQLMLDNHEFKIKIYHNDTVLLSSKSVVNGREIRRILDEYH